MTELEQSAATLAHLTEAVREPGQWVFLTDTEGGERLLDTRVRYVLLTGKGGGMEFGRVGSITAAGVHGLVSFLTVPLADLPFEAIRTTFVLFGNRPPGDPETNILLLAAVGLLTSAHISLRSPPRDDNSRARVELPSSVAQAGLTVLEAGLEVMTHRRAKQ